MILSALLFLVKWIGLSAAILGGMLALLALGKLASKLLGGPFVYDPNAGKYNYKPHELWQAPVYWTNWKTC